MSDLRAQVVEAMAQALRDAYQEMSWDEMAEAALDAALDLIDQEQLVQDVRSFVAALRLGSE